MKKILIITVIILGLAVSSALADVTMVAMKAEGQGTYIIWSSPTEVAKYQVVNGRLVLVEILNIINHPLNPVVAYK
jgi:hypothetical protein